MEIFCDPPHTHFFFTFAPVSGENAQIFKTNRMLLLSLYYLLMAHNRRQPGSSCELTTYLPPQQMHQHGCEPRKYLVWISVPIPCGRISFHLA